MKTPVIALNLKTYKEAAGYKAEKLAVMAKELANRSDKHVIVCPQNPELAYLARKYASEKNFSVYGQHVDAEKQGAFTGSIVPETLRDAGAKGSLLNHAEKKVGLETVEKTIARAKEAGIELIVCADSVQEAIAIAKFRPPCIAVEPPELIGKGVSISTAKPDAILKCVKEIKTIDPAIVVLVGAGVSTAEDVRKSRELGAEGVLLASAFAKNKSPRTLLEQMLQQL
ncbi:triose-phosphate isomerase [Candidatus Micrarchaeota archaeon]|nr:triose-phosphate isomerase [Candidatus Micrarchaeota archaeon]